MNEFPIHDVKVRKARKGIDFTCVSRMYVMGGMYGDCVTAVEVEYSLFFDEIHEPAARF